MFDPVPRQHSEPQLTQAVKARIFSADFDSQPTYNSPGRSIRPISSSPGPHFGEGDPVSARWLSMDSGEIEVGETITVRIEYISVVITWGAVSNQFCC